MPAAREGTVKISPVSAYRIRYKIDRPTPDVARFDVDISTKEAFMARQDLNVPTPDGICPASVFTPTSSLAPQLQPCPQIHPRPAVLFLMDGFGIRPVMWDVCQRIADAGYLVLLPDL
jgi:hypothetical protein